MLATLLPPPRRVSTESKESSILTGENPFRISIRNSWNPDFSSYFLINLSDFWFLMWYLIKVPHCWIKFNDFWNTFLIPDFYFWFLSFISDFWLNLWYFPWFLISKSWILLESEVLIGPCNLGHKVEQIGRQPCVTNWLKSLVMVLQSWQWHHRVQRQKLVPL